MKLTAEFVKHIKVPKEGLVELYVNPTFREFRDIKDSSKWKHFRFLADPVNKKVYVWRAEALLHEDAIPIVRNLGVKVGRFLFRGYTYHDFDYNPLLYDYSEEEVKKMGILKRKWTWLDRYFPMSQWVTEAQDLYAKREEKKKARAAATPKNVKGKGGFSKRPAERRIAANFYEI